MRNKEIWCPSKFLLKNGHLAASRDTSEVNIASRLAADIVAEFYDSHIPMHATGKLLDLGCGKVPLYELYRDYIVDNICIDWENSRHDNIYLDLKCDLSESLPLGDEQFDTILLSDVMEHLPDPQKIWDEMFRLLVPGGKLLLNVPFLYWIHESPYDYYRYTEFALRRFAELSGFSIILLEPTGGLPEVTADLLSKYFLLHPHCKWIAASIQYFARRAMKTKIAKRISKKTSKSFPLGYFLIGQKP